MVSGNHHEREVRAARNQALFRAVNEKLTELNEALVPITGTLTIACECADTHCVEMIELKPDDYLAVRSEPRRFAVLAEHVIPDVENVVEDFERYVVVEKRGTAGDLTEVLAQETQAD
jgi:5-bromo-4-chloroindolyl phosphate hydrolysis protein